MIRYRTTSYDIESHCNHFALSGMSDHDALPLIFDLMRDEGLYLGGSSAINVAGAVEMAREMGPGHTIVTILCDSGQRYQSKVWNPEFLKSKDLPIPSWLELSML